jgi:hypothetical protein
VSTAFTKTSSQQWIASVTALTTGDWTMGGWYNPVDAGGSNIGFMQGQANGSNPGTIVQRYQIGAAGLTVSATLIFNTTNAVSTTSTTMTANAWNCVIVTYTSSDKTLRIYMGTLASAMAQASYGTQTAGVGTANSNGTTLIIGDRQQADFDFNGKIARVFATQRVLSADEMERFRQGDWTALWNGTTTPLYYFPLDSANNSQDIVNQIVATVSGPTYSNEEPPCGFGGVLMGAT